MDPPSTATAVDTRNFHHRHTTLNECRSFSLHHPELLRVEQRRRASLHGPSSGPIVHLPQGAAWSGFTQRGERWEAFGRGGASFMSQEAEERCCAIWPGSDVGELCRGATLSELGKAEGVLRWAGEKDRAVHRSGERK
ncbi:hypothetical protein Droror1_Dr00027095 [Drosera rotundifolia]